MTARNDPNSWIVLPRRSYPYTSRPLNLPSVRVDPYQRNIASLLSSLGAFANQLSQPLAGVVFHFDDILRFRRVCNNAMSIDDFRHFHTKVFISPGLRSGYSIVHIDHLPTEDNTSTTTNDTPPDLSPYNFIILSTLCTTGKLVIFLILPNQSTIDAYCTTEILYH